MSVCSLIAAAGAGRRMGAGVNKVFMPLGGEPVLLHALRAFESCDAVDEITVVASPAEVDAASALVRATRGLSKVRRVVAGGERRQDSVFNGLRSLDAACDIVVVHDGARPLIRPELIARVVAAARKSGAAIAAVPIRDTVKLVREGVVVETLDRESLWAAATPQAFRRDLLEAAYEKALTSGADGPIATDDAMLAEAAGIAVTVVPGDADNIKITTRDDLAAAEALLAARLGVAAAGYAADEARVDAGPIRAGFGFDVHRLVRGRRLVLGGVEIASEVGLDGHSDADVVLHAIADAVLGACALGDIGRAFPDDDPAYSGISSVVLLERVRDMALDAGFVVNNVDVMLLAERPRISAHVPHMRATIACALSVPVDRVSVKATTMEGMGFVGAGEGMACFASCSVRGACAERTSGSSGPGGSSGPRASS